jgi:hypothetical protein
MNQSQVLSNKIAGFIFKAQIFQETLAKDSKSVGDKSELSFESISRKVSLEYLDRDTVEDAKKMSAVYIAIASFENMLREIISQVLLEKVDENWWQSKSVSAEIRKKAAAKQNDEKQNRWHNPRGLSPIYFTELKDLVHIMTQQDNWLFFEDLLGDPDWVRHSIKSLERSRNVIMHSGQLALEDIERVGITIRDWMRQLGG